MIFLKNQLTFLFISIFAATIICGCGGDSDDGSDSTAASEPDPGPLVTIEQFSENEEEIPLRSPEDGWFQVRIKAKPIPKDQDLIVRVRLLFTELNISEEQVAALKDDAFDEILWFRIPKLSEFSEAIWIRSTITTALQVVELPRRHKFETDTKAVDDSTIPEWWVPSPYQPDHPSVLIHRYE